MLFPDPHGSGRRVTGAILLALVTGLFVPGKLSADPGVILQIMVNEVYSNADGTKQFVELIALANGQTDLAPSHVESINANGSDTTMVYDFTTPFSQLGNNETILLATSAAVVELGFNADKVIPNNSISITNGKVVFDQDVGAAIDAVAYGAYTGNNTGFGTPALALPTNGQSLTRIRYSFVTPNNSTDFVYATNSPKRNDGASGSLAGDPIRPVLAPIGAQGVDEGSLLAFTINATDDNGTIPTLLAVNLPIGSSFVDQQNGSGHFSWTPTYLQSGIDTVLFIATDGALADSEKVEITVIEVNNPPVARDSSTSTNEDTPFGAKIPASDPDADAIHYSILSGPFRGQVSNFDSLTGLFTYSPNLNVNGPDSLTFHAHDQHGFSNSAKWRVTVNPVNDAPVAGVVNASTVTNVNIFIGSMPVTDVDNGSWTITHVSGPFHGTVSNLNAATGSFDYAPASSYVGSDSITYKVFDGTDTSAHARIRFVITPACGCVCPDDPICDGIRSNIQDVVATVNVAFRGTAPTVDGGCTRERTDVNCSGTTDIVDVVKVVGVAFRGLAASTEYCNPCAP